MLLLQYTSQKSFVRLSKKEEEKGSHDINSSKENALALKTHTPSIVMVDVVLMFVGSGETSDRNWT